MHMNALTSQHHVERLCRGCPHPLLGITSYNVVQLLSTPQYINIVQHSTPQQNTIVQLQCIRQKVLQQPPLCVLPGKPFLPCLLSIITHTPAPALLKPPSIRKFIIYLFIYIMFIYLFIYLFIIIPLQHTLQPLHSSNITADIQKQPLKPSLILFNYLI